jgi:hypothetical protein
MILVRAAAAHADEAPNRTHRNNMPNTTFSLTAESRFFIT